MTTRIELIMNPADAERSAILKPLRAYNVAQAGEANAETFALLVRDEHTHEALGGLHGEIFYQWMFIELLAVPEHCRGQGTGARLMGMAEELAREKGCVGIWLDTFDFQAPGFYRKLGFSELGHIDDFPPGRTRFFFQKRLKS